ncbi:hypothetical protein BDV12DRAFT_134555 [Aspergillus spectabilis]
MNIAASFGMPLRWRKRPQRPLGPFVEDEIDSLSRELNGSSHIGELSGFEGVKSRGAVNQSPLILDVEILIAPKPSSNVEEGRTRGGRSGFSANQFIPMMETKQGPKQNPMRRPAGESQSQGLGQPRSRSPPKPQDVPLMTQPTRPVQTQVPEVKRTAPSTTQKPVPRQPEPTPRTSGARVDALPLKSMSDVSQRNQAAPSRTPSLRRQEQHKSGSPTRQAQPGAAQSHGMRTSSPSKRIPDVAPKPQTVPSRTPPVRRDKSEYIPSQATLPPSELARNSCVRTSSPPKRRPDVAQTAQAVQSRPLPAPQQSQQRLPPTIPHQPAPLQDTGLQGYALPPKQQHDVTRHSQPTVPRPLPTSPDDGPRKPNPSRDSPPVTAARETGVRMDMAPRPLADVPQKTQGPPYPHPVPLEQTQYKSFPPTLPPRPLPEMSQRSQTMPLHPLPNPPADGPRTSSSSTVKRSVSLKQRPSTKPPTTQPIPTTSGYTSDSAAVRYPQVPRPTSQSPPLPADKNSPPSPRVSVAERLEEKLKLRREQRESGDYHLQSKPSSPPDLKVTDSPSPSVQPPGAWPSDVPYDPSPDRLTQFPTLDTATGVENPQTENPQTDKPQAAAVPLKPALRSQSLDRTQPSSIQPTRRRTVSFAEKPLEAPSQALVKVDHEAALTRLQSQQDGSPDSSRSSSPNAGLTLAPCPRSIPVAGYQDWYTIERLNHLDICPSCVKQMRKTKFRDRLTLSVPKPRTEPIQCAMSEPWARLAWVQTLKKKLDTLDLLRDITLPPKSIKPCPGRIINDQYWYRVIDPGTGIYLPQFNVCPECVHNIRLLMPAHRETFERSSIPQERVCDFVTDSPRFIRYIDALDLSANRADSEDSKSPLDLSEFLAYVRRKVVLRDCRRSRLIFDKWHYMPQLPEFTVCEDCFDDVVHPLAKARHAIALDFSRTMRLLPGDSGSGSHEASCQLYSPRIRAKFNDAVRRNDMPFIKWMAMTRFDAEQRFRGRQDELVENQRRGYDCSGDIRKNLEDWKRYE